MMNDATVTRAGRSFHLLSIFDFNQVHLPFLWGVLSRCCRSIPPFRHILRILYNVHALYILVQYNFTVCTYVLLESSPCDWFKYTDLVTFVSRFWVSLLARRENNIALCPRRTARLRTPCSRTKNSRAWTHAWGACLGASGHSRALCASQAAPPRASTERNPASSAPVCDVHWRVLHVPCISIPTRNYVRKTENLFLLGSSLQ